MKKAPPSPRAIVLTILTLIETGNERIDPLLNKYFLGASDLRDRAFAAQIAYGVTRYKLSLDTLINSSSNTPIAKMSPEILTILRMGLYQAIVMGSVPESAAVNESVKLAKLSKKTKPFVGFVNGVLRGVLRKTAKQPSLEEKALATLSIDVSVEEKLAIKYSFPEWLIKRWIVNFGVEKAEQIATASNQKAPTFLRSVISRDDLYEIAGSSDIELTPVDLLPNAYKVVSGNISPATRLVTEGYIQPQDLSSMIAASLLSPKPGMVVADVCCGKGIKSSLFIRAVGESGKVTSIDSSYNRLVDFAENMRRQKIFNSNPLVADAANQWPVRQKFDAIFIDAPCSSTGVIRRHPESKWNRAESFISRIAVVQREILSEALKWLKPGGRLLYAVCSVEPEESTNIVNSALELHRDSVRRIDIGKERPELIEAVTKHGDLLILPGLWDSDGFYCAILTTL